MVIKLVRSKHVYVCFLAGDCEPVYERVDSNPELESQPTDLNPGIQNVGQPVIS
jgi:hypothetical protein